VSGRPVSGRPVSGRPVSGRPVSGPVPGAPGAGAGDAGVLRLLPCGDAALLVELADLDAVLALADALAVHPPPGCEDVVPAARTVLVRYDPSLTSTAAVRRHLAGLPLVARGPGGPRPPGTGPAPPALTLPVRYDGADLLAVADLLAMTPADVVAWHVGTAWTVAFTGFAPGFGYLVGEPSHQVPRRAEPRIRVPAGSVGLADTFTGVYPGASPGGWQLIGRTSARLWDVDRDPPALLAPGTRVRFRRAS
jgi:KipI family sensor histidine kinase inhibitor